jgi:hypothetical protein
VPFPKSSCPKFIATASGAKAPVFLAASGASKDAPFQNSLPKPSKDKPFKSFAETIQKRDFSKTFAAWLKGRVLKSPDTTGKAVPFPKSSSPKLLPLLQGLKPRSFFAACGASKNAPFQSSSF